MNFSCSCWCFKQGKLLPVHISHIDINVLNESSNNNCMQDVKSYFVDIL